MLLTFYILLRGKHTSQKFKSDSSLSLDIFYFFGNCFFSLCLAGMLKKCLLMFHLCRETDDNLMGRTENSLFFHLEEYETNSETSGNAKEGTEVTK